MLLVDFGEPILIKVNLRRLLIKIKKRQECGRIEARAVLIFWFCISSVQSLCLYKTRSRLWFDSLDQIQMLS